MTDVITFTMLTVKKKHFIWSSKEKPAFNSKLLKIQNFLSTWILIFKMCLLLTGMKVIVYRFKFQLHDISCVSRVGKVTHQADNHKDHCVNTPWIFTQVKLSIQLGDTGGSDTRWVLQKVSSFILIFMSYDCLCVLTDLYYYYYYFAKSNLIRCWIKTLTT